MQISPFHYEGKWGGFSSWCKIDLKAQRSSKQPPPALVVLVVLVLGHRYEAKSTWLPGCIEKKVLQSALMPHSMEKWCQKGLVHLNSIEVVLRGWPVMAPVQTWIHRGMFCCVCPCITAEYRHPARKTYCWGCKRAKCKSDTGLWLWTAELWWSYRWILMDCLVKPRGPPCGRSCGSGARSAGLRYFLRATMGPWAMCDRKHLWWVTIAKVFDGIVQ